MVVTSVFSNEIIIADVQKPTEILLKAFSSGVVINNYVIRTNSQASGIIKFIARPDISRRQSQYQQQSGSSGTSEVYGSEDRETRLIDIIYVSAEKSAIGNSIFVPKKGNYSTEYYISAEGLQIGDRIFFDITITKE